MIDTLRESLGRNASFKLVLILLLAAMLPCYCVGGILLVVSNNNRGINPSLMTPTAVTLDTTATPTSEESISPSITPFGNPTSRPPLQPTPTDFDLSGNNTPPAFSTYDTRTLFPPEPITTMAVTPGNVDSSSPLAQCLDDRGNTSTVMRTNMNSGVAPGASLFCKKIANDYEIGIQSVLDRGVKVAVELQAFSGGSSVKTFQQPLRVCLFEQGVFLFLDTNGTPRTAVERPSVVEDGYTCADIPNPGMVVITSR
jgi:hypothetical protein